MTQIAKHFVAKYTVTLSEIVSTPGIFRQAAASVEDLPHPGMAVIRDLAEFAGYGYGAVRTAVSRIRFAGGIDSFVDSSGRTRFRLTTLTSSVGDVVQAWQSRPDGLIVVVYSFRKEEETARRSVRDILRYFGFKRIAQNTYVHGMIDTRGMEAEVARAGVASKLFVFRCPRVDDPALRARLLSVFDLPGRVRVLTRLARDLRAFLEEPEIDGMEFGRRVLYAGPVHYRMCFVEEPPLPADFFPADYPMRELAGYLRAAAAVRWNDVLGYYRTLCG